MTKRVDRRCWKMLFAGGQQMPQGRTPKPASHPVIGGQGSTFSREGSPLVSTGGWSSTDDSAGSARTDRRRVLNLKETSLVDSSL